MSPEQKQWVDTKALEYLQRHPEVTPSYAREQARKRWHRRQKAIHGN